MQVSDPLSATELVSVTKSTAVFARATEGAKVSVSVSICNLIANPIPDPVPVSASEGNTGYVRIIEGAAWSD